MYQLAEFLTSIEVPLEMLRWAKNRSWPQAWHQCDRPEWLLWIASRMAGIPNWPSRKEVIAATCACAEMAFVYLPIREVRPAHAIRMARAWIQGKVIPEMVREASLEARQAAFELDHAGAHAAARAADAAAYAAIDAFLAATVMESEDNSTTIYAVISAVADAAFAAADATGYANDYREDAEERKRVLYEMSNTIRNYLTVPTKLVPRKPPSTETLDRLFPRQVRRSNLQRFTKLEQTRFK